MGLSCTKKKRVKYFNLSKTIKLIMHDVVGDMKTSVEIDTVLSPNNAEF